jgi:hypothetical protein
VRKVATASAIIRRTTAFDAAIPSTWTAFETDGSHDLSVPASVGDFIELGVSMLGQSVAASTQHGYLDIATMVAGSPLNWASTNRPAHSQGIMSMFSPGAYANPGVAGSILYKVRPEDIVGGNVTFRLYGKSTSTSRVWSVSVNDPAIFYAVKRG